MMKILIIEDEIKAAKELKRIIEENIADAEIMEILNSVKDSVRWFQENPMPDLIFSDIQLADGLSFSIFQNVEILCPVIFCTAYDQYAIDAFDTNSIDYLLKPIEEDKLVKAVKKFKKFKEYYQDENTKIRLASNQITNTPKSTLLVYFQEKIIPVKTEDISFFYATGGVNRIYTKQGKMFHINITLDELETQLSASQFFKANRQFIINRESILSIHHYFGRKFLIKLNYETPEEITISKGKSSEFMKWMES